MIGKVTNAFKAIVESARKALGGMPEMTNALEQAIRLTDKGLTLREVEGRGAKKSRMTIEQLKRFRDREVDPQDYLAPIKDPESRFYGELRSRRVPPDVAREIAKILVEELSKNGGKPTLKAALPHINALGKQYGAPITGRPGSAASAKVQQQRMGVTSTSNTPRPAPKPTGLVRRIMDKLGAERFREEVLDYNRPVERLQETIEEALGRPLTDDERIYDQKRLLEPKVTGALRRLEVNELNEAKSLMRAAAKMGVDFKQLGRGLIAHHAEERNESKGNFDRNSEKGSGMSAVDADKILADIKADPKQQALFDRLVELNKRLRDIELDSYVASGILTKAQADDLRNSSKTYTSLRGFEDDALSQVYGGDESLRGTNGMSVLGKDIRKAEGRESISDNPLQNMFQQAARAIERAETNKVIKNSADAIRKAGFTKEDGVYVAENIGATPAKTVREALLDPRIIGFKEDGVQKFLVFEDRAQAEAFKRLSPDNLNAVLDVMVNTLNKVKNLWTHYSPEFLIRHFVFRYPIEGAMNLKGMKEQGLRTGALGYFKDAFSAIADINRYLQGNKVKDPKIAAAIREMEEAGGIVSFRNVSDTMNLKDREARITLDKENPLKAAHEHVDRFLTAMDSAERLAIYMRAREAGKSPQEAAILARDATVDFAKKGKSAGLMSVWLEFGNVAVQTTARMGRAFTQSKNYRRTLYGIMGAAAALEVANYLFGGEDEDGTPLVEKIPAYERIQNIVIITGKSDKGNPTYIKIPLPYPLFGIWTAGSGMTQSAMSAAGKSKLKQGEIVSRIGHGMAETLTPFGRNVNNMASLLVPGMLRPIGDINSNKDWKGDSIHTDFPKKGLDKADQARTGTDPGWTAFAKGLSKIGIDAYPEDIKHVVDHFVGAQRRLVSNAIDTVKGNDKDERPANRIPFARVVYGEAETAQADRARLYNLGNKAAVTPETMKALRATEYGNTNKTQQALVQAAERRTGYDTKQLLAINAMMGEVKKYDKEVRAAEPGSSSRTAAEKRRSDFIAKKMKELNDLGVKGGVDRHGG
jgi:hypothetical protein